MTKVAYKCNRCGHTVKRYTHNDVAIGYYPVEGAMYHLDCADPYHVYDETRGLIVLLPESDVTRGRMDKIYLDVTTD